MLTRTTTLTSRTTRRGWWALPVALSPALFTAACDQVRAAVGAAPPLHGAAYTPPAPAPPLRLPRAHAAGRAPGAASGAVSAAADTFDLARDATGAGRAALVFFGYTHCPDVCPTTLSDWVRVKRTLAARAAADTGRVRFVFVTVDPARDSAAVVARYVTQFDPSFVGLAGSQPAVDAAQRAWGVASFRESAAGGGSSYTVAHPAQVFLVGPEGHLRTIYPLGAPPADVAADLHQVLRGG